MFARRCGPTDVSTGSSGHPQTIFGPPDCAFSQGMRLVSRAPAETLRKCNELIEERVQARIANGQKELAARSFVLSDRDAIGSQLYKLS